MPGKVYTVENKRVKYQFIVPALFKENVVNDGIKSIRTGYGSNWERPFIGKETGVADFEMSCLEAKNKFIVLCDEKMKESQKYMFIFPKDIDHDRMLEALRNIVYDNESAEERHLNDRPLTLSVYSAGFLNNVGMCYGHSATLEVNSKKDDSDTFSQCFKN